MPKTKTKKKTTKSKSPTPRKPTRAKKKTATSASSSAKSSRKVDLRSGSERRADDDAFYLWYPSYDQRGGEDRRQG